MQNISYIQKLFQFIDIGSSASYTIPKIILYMFRQHLYLSAFCKHILDNGFANNSLEEINLFIFFAAEIQQLEPNLKDRSYYFT